VKRRLGYLALVAGVACSVGTDLVGRVDLGVFSGEFGGVKPTMLLSRGLLVASVALAVIGSYVILVGLLVDRTDDKRCQHDLRSLLRFLFIVLAVVGVTAVLTRQYLGLLFSLGIVGFAVTFALQQPLFSLIGWVYIMVKRPYGVGDRVAIEGSKGDVVEVDFLVTKLWE